jgi:hypothetical protein
VFSPMAPLWLAGAYSCPLLQGSPEVVDLFADLLEFGPERRFPAVALVGPLGLGVCPGFFQPHPVGFEFRDPVSNFSSPAYGRPDLGPVSGLLEASPARVKTRSEVEEWASPPGTRSVA